MKMIHTQQQGEREQPTTSLCSVKSWAPTPHPGGVQHTSMHAAPPLMHSRMGRHARGSPTCRPWPVDLQLGHGARWGRGGGGAGRGWMGSPGTCDLPARLARTTLSTLDSEPPPVRALRRPANLGVLGCRASPLMPGLLDVGELREATPCPCRAAAGAVADRRLIAKCAGSATVIGASGSAEQVAHLLDDLGFDAAHQHHDGDVAGACCATPRQRE